jgi:NAD+ kinase
MKFIVRHKERYGDDLRRNVTSFLEQQGAEWTEEIGKADFALSIGGDGTLMRDHHLIRCPVLGINPGKSIGYYLGADSGNYRKRITALLSGKEGRDYHVHRLLRLEAYINRKRMEGLALNDVLVSPVYVRRMLQARLCLTGKESIERNSGIIVYTPTGSHAFAHSAGAAKMPHGSGFMGVTALAPYSGMLKGSEITVERGHVRIESLSETGEVCIDGSETNVKSIGRGDVIEVRKSRDDLRLVGFSSRFG